MIRIEMRPLFILVLLFTNSMSYADNIPPNAHINVYGNGWECDRGYYRSGSECKQVIVPRNAHINVYGNGWECDRGYYRSGQQCMVVTLPPNAYINVYGNGWECDGGYYRSGSQCKQVIVPNNAHINVYGNGWECDKGFKQIGKNCSLMTESELKQQNDLEKALINKMHQRRSSVSSAVGNACRSSEDAGVVIKEDVCGSGNSIIETTDGWYIAAEHYSGVYLYEGDIVCGNMKKYGFEDLYRADGSDGRFYIEDWESNIDDAYEELCD